MKRLFLVRHTEAASSSNGSDIERTLTPTGHAQAKSLGTLMTEKGYKPDLVLCSTSLRTRQTFDGMAETSGDAAVNYEEAIYHGPAGPILGMIQNVDDGVQSLMVVGHNPTIYQLAVMLAKDEAEQANDKMLMGYPPGSMTVLGIHVDSWADIQPGDNMLLNLHCTSDYHQGL